MLHSAIVPRYLQEIFLGCDAGSHPMKRDLESVRQTMEDRKRKDYDLTWSGSVCLIEKRRRFAFSRGNTTALEVTFHPGQQTASARFVYALPQRITMGLMISLVCVIAVTSGDVIGIIWAYAGLQLWGWSMLGAHLLFGKYYDDMLVEFLESCL